MNVIHINLVKTSRGTEAISGFTDRTRFSRIFLPQHLLYECQWEKDNILLSQTLSAVLMWIILIPGSSFFKYLPVYGECMKKIAKKLLCCPNPWSCLLAFHDSVNKWSAVNWLTCWRMCRRGEKLAYMVSLCSAMPEFQMDDCVFFFFLNWYSC